MAKVLYPGSFDPITKGHTNIIEQASGLFDEVVVAVLTNSAKNAGMFTVEERLGMIEEIYKDVQNVKVVSGTGAAVDLAILYGCKAMVRGIRDTVDCAGEIRLAGINKKISNDEVNTVCLFAEADYTIISSSMVKEVFGLGKDISDFVDPIVEEKMLVKRGVMSNGK